MDGEGGGAFDREGIRVSAVTVQNEPETDQGLNSPTCLWSAEESKTFVVDFLEPTLARNGLSTQIWAYDHNFDAKGVDYVAHQLSDARFRAATAAVAWSLRRFAHESRTRACGFPGCADVHHGNGAAP